MLAPTQRFSSRVDNYVRYRPSYPVAAIDLLRHECRLNSNAVVADIGSGTGKLTALLLRRSGRVFGVGLEQRDLHFLASCAAHASVDFGIDLGRVPDDT